MVRNNGSVFTLESDRRLAEAAASDSFA